MSHLGARVLRVLKEDISYELRDIEDNPISKSEARRLVLSLNTMCQRISVKREDGATAKLVRIGRQRLTGQTRQAKLLNLYKSKPSPDNNSNQEGSGGQVPTIDNY